MTSSPPGRDPSSHLFPEVKLKPREEDRLLGGHLWVFSNEIAEHPAGLPPGSVVRLVSGRGAFLGVGFYNPASLIAVRVLSRQGDAPDARFFRERLEKALAYRRDLFPGATSYRLCYGESDGLPGLLVDRYGELLVAQVLSAGMDRCWPEVQQALVELLGPKGILLRNDNELRKLEGLETGIRAAWGQVPDTVEIEDDGLRFRIAPMAGQKTGFYLDQRQNRAFLKPFFEGRGVLDLYCYSGAFALTAARAGAKRVLGVDSSEPAVELARAAAALNGLEAACRFEKGDAERVLTEVGESAKEGRPDFILLDPPNLAPSKKSLPKALKAFERLNHLGLKALRRGGLIATSSCSHHVSREAFVDMLRTAARRSGKQVRLLALRGQSADHPVLLSMPETEYLNFALLQVI